MSSTHLINEAVAHQNHASEQQGQSRLPQQRENAGSSACGLTCPNVGSSERTMSLLAGAVLVGMGLTRGGLSGMAMLGMGGGLAFRGATGFCSVYRALGIDTAAS